jgi:hypothetical protein
MFAGFDQKTKVLALNEVLLNDESRKCFYSAILTKPVTETFFS